MRLDAEFSKIFDSERGFTLVELLVVIAMIGLLSAAVVLSLPDGSGAVREEAERLAARARTAQTQAIVTGRTVALRLDAEGYGFEAREAGGWVASGEEALARRSWDDGVTGAMESGDGRMVFDSTGLAEPGAILLSRGDERARIVIGGDGRIVIDG